jgi:hypothetical protein
VQDADLETIFRKETDGLWEELQQASRRIRAGASADSRFAAETH